MKVREIGPVAELIAKLLPFWGPHRLLNLTTGDRLTPLEPALGGVAYGLGLLATAALLMARRLRVEAPRPSVTARTVPAASEA